MRRREGERAGCRLELAVRAGTADGGPAPAGQLLAVLRAPVEEFDGSAAIHLHSTAGRPRWLVLRRPDDAAAAAAAVLEAGEGDGGAAIELAGSVTWRATAA